MKISKAILSITVISFFLCGCKNETPLPFATFEELNYGAYPRLIDGINGYYGTAYNYFDVENSAIDFTVEMVDEYNGQNISSYTWTVAHSDGTIAAISSSAFCDPFGTSPSGLPMVCISFTFQDVLDVLNKTIDDVAGGERFIFEATLTKTDGSIFTSQNTSGSIQSTAGTFRGMFQVVVPIICFSELEGLYASETTAFCDEVWTGQVRLVQDSPGEYKVLLTDEVFDDFFDFGFGVSPACYDYPDVSSEGSIRLKDDCRKLSFIGLDRWGTEYFFNDVSVDGAHLTLDWYNTYDFESNVTVLTRTDGTDWPDLID